jgi:predicted GNAT family N-acyltransferase
MAVEKEKVIGCCRLQMNNDKEAQVRYMAVDGNMQGKGIGKKIMKQAEKIAKDKGAEFLILEARENAVPFYKGCGYVITKKSYLLFDEIQHFTMQKHLSEEPSL